MQNLNIEGYGKLMENIFPKSIGTLKIQSYGLFSGAEVPSLSTHGWWGVGSILSGAFVVLDIARDGSLAKNMYLEPDTEANRLKGSERI